MRKDLELTIRMAKPGDAKAIREIYEPYVKNTAITFEYEVPTVEEMEHRICNTLTRFPFLVAEKQGQILGYAYVSPFKARKAYDWAVETTIYIKQNAKGVGYGKALYHVLEGILKQQNILNMNACIAFPTDENPYVNMDSVKFHEHMGYQLCGRFHKCGYKFNKWFDMVWMEKMIGEHETDHPEVIPIGEMEVDTISFM